MVVDLCVAAEVPCWGAVVPTPRAAGSSRDINRFRPEKIKQYLVGNDDRVNCPCNIGCLVAGTIWTVLTKARIALFRLPTSQQGIWSWEPKAKTQNYKFQHFPKMLHNYGLCSSVNSAPHFWARMKTIKALNDSLTSNEGKPNWWNETNSRELLLAEPGNWNHDCWLFREKLCEARFGFPVVG